MTVGSIASPVWRQMCIIPCWWRRMTLVSSVQMTCFKFSSVQWRCARAKSSHAFFIAAVRPGLNVGFTFRYPGFGRTCFTVFLETPSSLVMACAVASRVVASWEWSLSIAPKSIFVIIFIKISITTYPSLLPHELLDNQNELHLWKKHHGKQDLWCDYSLVP